VQAASPWELSDQQLVGARACSLTDTQAAELLLVLARSRTDDTEDPDPDHPQATTGTDLRAALTPTIGTDFGSGQQPDELAGFPAESGTTQTPVTVRLLGAMQITTPAGELRTGLRASAASCSPTT
jgi:hypothetical protein